MRQTKMHSNLRTVETEVGLTCNIKILEFLFYLYSPWEKRHRAITKITTDKRFLYKDNFETNQNYAKPRFPKYSI